MTDLYLALLAVGAIIIAAVILFNWWQERSIHNDTVRHIEGPVDDVLMDQIRKESSTEASVGPETGQKVEPTIDLEQVGVESGAAIPDEAALPPLDEAAPAEAVFAGMAPPSLAMQQQDVDVVPSAAGAGSGGLPAGVDERIDLVAVIVPEQPCSGEKLREALLPQPHPGKTCQWLALNVDQVWCPLAKNQEQAVFSKLVGTLQLADRSGAISKDMLRSFQLKTDETAKRLTASLAWRGPADPLHYAQELDKFCMDVDVMVGVHLVASNGSLAGTKLRGLAEAGGMTLHDDGRFHYDNELGETLFTMANQERSPLSAELLRTPLVHAVTLQLDVPRVKNFPEAFNRMVLLAKRMEQGLGAKLVDGDNRALGEAEIEKIRQQLKAIHSTMVMHSILPGSATALRLFS